MATKTELKAEKDKIRKLQTFDPNLFIDQDYFFNDGSQHFLTFQPILNTFTIPDGLRETVVAWQSKGFSNETIRPPTTSNNSLSPKLKWHNSKIRV